MESLTLGTWIILLLRLSIPILVLRWRIQGFFAALLIDALDVTVIKFLNAGEYSSYVLLDKLLDSYTLLLMVLASLQ